MLDEPTVGLGPELRQELWILFRGLAGRRLTLAESSHVMDEAARCDRLQPMRDGEILADDTPDGLRAATGTSDLFVVTSVATLRERSTGTLERLMTTRWASPTC